MSSLYSKMAQGAAWMVFFKLLERLIGLGSIVVLARLLAPADFGIVAMATASIAVLEVLGAFSFDIALIQRPEADHTYYNTAWTFNVIVGVTIGGLVALLAQPAASFYEEPRLAALLLILALNPVIGAVENVGVVAFRKEMQFQKEFIFLISKKLTSVSITLVLALVLRNYWALAIGVLTGRTAGTVLSYIMSPYRPQLSLQRRRELMHFSTWSFLTNILSFVQNRTGDFVIGKTSGPAALGVYNVASEVSNLPTTELVAPINRAVFPAYAKMNSETDALQTGYLRVLGMIAALTIPAALGIVATADVFVPLVFGVKWIDAVPLIQIIAFYGLIQSLQNNVGSVFYALGLYRTSTLMSFIYNVLMVPLLIFGAMKWDAKGAALALLTAIAMFAPFNINVCLSKLRLKPKDFVLAVWRPLCAGAVMFAAVGGIKLLFEARREEFLIVELAILIVSGFLSYVAALMLLWRLSGMPAGAERDLLDQIRNRLSRMRVGAA